MVFNSSSNYQEIEIQVHLDQEKTKEMTIKRKLCVLDFQILTTTKCNIVKLKLRVEKKNYMRGYIVC